MLRLLAGSLAALSVLLVAGYLIGAQLAERQALADAERFTGLVGNSVIAPQLTAPVLAGEPGAMDALDRLVEARLLGSTSIRRVKVWSTEGRVLYSDDRDEIGDSFPLDPAELAALTSGAATSAVSSLHRAENAQERDLASQLVEVYTGIEAADGTPLIFEAYLSYDEVKSHRATVFTMLGALAAVLIAVFALFLMTFTRANLQWLRRRQVELDRSREEVADRERRRVVRDLHDGVVQELVATGFAVEGARVSVREDRGDTDQLLSAAADGVRASVQALRSVLVDVYPHTLDDRGLASALDDLVQPLRTRHVSVDVEVDLQRAVSRAALEATYRAAQEAVRNVGRHARATVVLVRVSHEPGRLVLTIRDDGVGIEASRLASVWQADGHVGLRSLADLALEQEGDLEVRTAPGRGTEIRWEIPA